MKRFTRVELFKENFKFSSGHFTIFSKTERENIHGHNFSVYVAFDAQIRENGIIFDYTIAKAHIEAMCRELNEYFLLPGLSEHIRIERAPDYTYVYFSDEKIPFLARDIKILPIKNITVEDLSAYFLDKFVNGFVRKGDYAIASVEIKVFSGPGQSANAVWNLAS